MMTRKIIQSLIDGLNALMQISDLSEYVKAKDVFLAKAIPLCKQSKKTMAFVKTMKESLHVGYYIPTRDKTGCGEITIIEKKARDDIHKRIIQLKALLKNIMKVNLPLMALAFMCLSGGIFTLVYFNSLIATAVKSPNWPSVRGQLLKIRLSEHRSSSSAGPMGTRIETVTYGIDVEYQYHIGDTAYKGRKFSFEPHTGDRPYWEAKTHQFDAGSRVNIYYDPRSPKNSVLETGDYKKNYIFIIMGLGFTCIGVYFMTGIIRFRFC